MRDHGCLLIDVEQHVAVQQEERPRSEQGRCPADSSARAQDVPHLARDGDGDVDLATDFEGAFFHFGGEVVRIHHHVANAGVAQQRQVVAEQRNPAERHQGLGDAVGERAQPRPESGAKDHRLHRDQPYQTISLAPVAAEKGQRYSTAGVGSGAGRRNARASAANRPCKRLISPT